MATFIWLWRQIWIIWLSVTVHLMEKLPHRDSTIQKIFVWIKPTMPLSRRSSSPLTPCASGVRCASRRWTSAPTATPATCSWARTRRSIPTSSSTAASSQYSHQNGPPGTYYVNRVETGCKVSAYEINSVLIDIGGSKRIITPSWVIALERELWSVIYNIYMALWVMV